ncbi:unnamed protein product [Effrenium voratum]|nr:unnamed protein product [Effrenium voratum]
MFLNTSSVVLRTVNGTPACTSKCSLNSYLQAGAWLGAPLLLGLPLQEQEVHGAGLQSRLLGTLLATLREDLYKKFVSGDGIAGRKPYGFKTRMINCVGWKRLEANRMFPFADVGRKDFNAILRRSLVWRVKARFEDPQALAAAYEDIFRDGVFPKDSDLADFLRSAPAVAAGLQLQHAFETQYSKQQCIDLIEDYVVWGGDFGLTETTMLEAMWRKSREQWQQLHNTLVEHMLDKRRLQATRHSIRDMKYKDGPNVSKEAILDGLLQLQLVRQATGKTRAEVAYIPVIRCQKTLSDLIDYKSRDSEVKLPEEYNITAFTQYMLGRPFRKENATVLAKVLKALGNSKRAGRGRATADAQRQREAVLERAQKIEDAEKNGDDLLDTLSEISAKRRRLHVKTEGARTEAEEVGRATRQCSYHYSGPESVRSRKYVTGVGAQKFPRRAQMHLLRGTWDLDIENSVFAMLHQLLQELGPKPAMPAKAAAALADCAERRHHVIGEVLKMTKDEGKHLLTSVLHGGTIPPSCDGQEFLQNLQRASIYCRWVAVSLLPAEYEAFCADPSKKNPEASALSHLYMACEDVVLSEWIRFLSAEVTPTHLSLHFDGVRVSASEHGDATALSAKCQEAIASKTIFKLRIREKNHAAVMALLRGAATRQGPPRFEAGTTLTTSGNCIPHALACLDSLSEEGKSKLDATTEQMNVYMEQRGCRTYQQCSAAFGCLLHPVVFIDALPVGKFLLHAENDGSPHCVAVHRREVRGAFEVTVWDTDCALHLSDSAFRRCLSDGVDSKTCVFYLLEQPADGLFLAVSEAEVSQLLDMAAGAVGEVDFSMDVDRMGLGQDAGEETGVDWLDADGVVTVDAVLLQELRQEVLTCIARAGRGSLKCVGGMYRCPACPFRAFRDCSRVAQHLRRYHTEKQRFCCSGTKQLRVLLSIHDTDMLAESRGGRYLERSAKVIRELVKPGLPIKNNNIDRGFRLVLDAGGPTLMNVAVLAKGTIARRVGKIWYTRAFAERLFQEILLQHAKAGPESGAVLGLAPAIGERAEHIVSCVVDALPAEALQRVKYVASDCPSAKLMGQLQAVLPNLQALVLDGTHAAMHYEQATNGRKTAGSALLRKFLAKFCPRDNALAVNIWGAPYDGSLPARLSAPENALREHIIKGTLGLRRARHVLASVDGLSAWPTRIQFIEAVAALAREHSKNLERKIEGTRETVGKILYHLTAADRLEWLFNNLRLRTSMTSAALVLLPSGTTGNEALHAELNAAFRQVQQLHRSTLQLKLNILHLAKLLPHHVALHSPTAKQMPAGHVLARRVGTPLWTTRMWSSWVAEQHASGAVGRCSLPLAAQRQMEQEAIQAARGLKRPAAGMRKRTPFTLERAPGASAAGVRFRRPASHAPS